jgi:hypothetical protein
MFFHNESTTENLGLPVEVCGLDPQGVVYHRNAEARDVSPYAARLTGIAALTHPGEIVELNCRGMARFQVIWADTERCAPDGEVGILNLEPSVDIWGVDWSANQKYRREHKRHDCGGSVRFKDDGGPSAIGEIRDLSLGGCFVLAASPPRTGTRLKLQLDISGQSIQAEGIVASQAKLGMGVRFDKLEPSQAMNLLQAVRIVSVTIVHT